MTQTLSSGGGSQRWFADLSPRRIAGAYVVFGLGLLVVSDILFPIVVTDPSTLRNLQGLKGAIEVALSGLLIYVLVVRSQRELRGTNELLEGVLDASPLAIVAADREGTTTVWSRGAEEMYGWSAEEALGEPAPNVPEEDSEDFEHLRERVFDEGEPVVGYETVRQTKDGSRIDVSITTGPMRDENGEVFGIMAVQEDVTERNARERELERLDRIVERLPVGVFRSTFDGRFTDVNDAFVDLLGAESKAELMEHDPQSFYAERETRDTFLESLENEGTVVDEELEVVTLDGDRKWVSTTLMLSEVDGERYLEGISLDVTERKERERELRETKQTLQAVIDASPIGIAAIDREGHTQLWNPGCERIFGWSEEEVLGEPLPSVPEAKEDEFEALREQIFEGGEPVVGYETVRQTRDGSLIDTSLTTAPMRDADGEVIGGMGLFEEITERKERERELRRERERFERVLETSPIGITILDAEGDIERANHRAEEILGLTSTEITDRTYDDPTWEIFDEEGDPIPAEELPFARVRDTGESVFDVEHGIRTADTERWLSVNAAPLAVTDDEEVERVVAAISDITEQRERKRALEASEERYRAIAESTPDAIVTIDGEHTIRFANDSVESVFGYTPDQLVGEPLTTLVPERLRDRHRASLSRFVETGECRIDWSAVEFPGLRADGEEVDLSLSFAAYENGGERRITAIIRDISERKRMERELRRSEQRYRGLIENAPVPINLFDEDGETVWGNDAVVDLLGLDGRGDLIGRSIFEFIHPDDHEVANTELVDVIEGDAVVGPTDFRLVRPDGEIRHVRVKTVGGWYEDERVGQAVVVDLTDIRRTETELRQNERRYRTLVEMSPEPILVHRDGEIVYANDALADLVGVEWRDELLNTPVRRYVDLEANSDVDEIITRTQAGEFEPTNRPYTVVTREGDRRHVETTSRPIAYEDRPAVLTIAKDVTDRYEYEQTLTSLHDRAQEMARTEDRGELVEIAIEAVDELLDFDGTVMYEFDGGDRLVPLACSEHIDEGPDELPVATKGTGVLWEVFVDGEDRFFQDVRTGDRVPHDLPLHSALVLPVSNYGVLLAGTRDECSLSATDREIAHLIGGSLDAALEGAEREQRLRERDRELERQNEQLEQLDRLNRVIRETTQTIIQAPSRSDVERRVCEGFASETEYSFAWLGIRDEASGRLLPEQWDEMDSEYVDHLASEDVRTPLHALVDAALRDGSVQVAQNVLEDPAWEDHRRDALNQGYRSVAVVPIVLNEAVDSVLVIHATAADLFDDREREVLEELGHTVGYALRNVERVETLETAERTEIELLIGDERLFTNRIAAELDVDIEFVGAIPGDGDSLRTFLRFSGVPAGGIESELREFGVVTDVQPLSVDEGTGLYQVTVETPRLIQILRGNDVRLRALTVHDARTTVTAVLTGDTSVRSLVEELRAAYPDTELQARREDTEPVDTRETFRDLVIDQLTEKQFDALRTALYGGFYEWPRASTSEELAATRDIASSTFQHHLRAAERKLVSAMLETA